MMQAASFTIEAAGSDDGSDAEDPFSEPEEHENYVQSYAMATHIGDRSELKPGQRYTAKVAPCWSGVGRWF